MELKEIRQIVELMDEHNLSLFHLQREGINLKLKKGVDADEVMALLRAHGAPAPSIPPPPVEGSSVESDSARPFASTDEREISSPMVGTFYRAPSPEAGPYVTVGDEVSEESVVCIIEAMKVMNEIIAESKGRITKILVEDGTPVQYGQPLFFLSSD